MVKKKIDKRNNPNADLMRIEELKRLIAGNGAEKEALQEELNELEAKYEV